VNRAPEHCCHGAEVKVGADADREDDGGRQGQEGQGMVSNIETFCSFRLLQKLFHF
jgi:hypothetical protein